MPSSWRKYCVPKSKLAHCKTFVCQQLGRSTTKLCAGKLQGKDLNCLHGRIHSTEVCTMTAIGSNNFMQRKTNLSRGLHCLKSPSLHRFYLRDYHPRRNSLAAMELSNKHSFASILCVFDVMGQQAWQICPRQQSISVCCLRLSDRFLW